MLAEGEADPERVKSVKKKIVKIKKKMKGFAFVPRRYLSGPIIELDVPAEGITDHAVVLTAQE